MMARFARDIVLTTAQLTKKLELLLGPDTADLAMRVGMHRHVDCSTRLASATLFDVLISEALTMCFSSFFSVALLRQEYSVARSQDFSETKHARSVLFLPSYLTPRLRQRFFFCVSRLFGDTMNTAARMESNGKPSKIHISGETAQLLIAHGKTAWVNQRVDRISAKGKGEMTTFWLEISSLSRSESVGSGTSESGVEVIEDHVEAADNKLVRPALQELPLKTQRLVQWNASCLLHKLQDVVSKRTEGAPESSLEGVTEEVSEQVKNYVEEVARRYHDNPFHNFEHVRFINHPSIICTKDRIANLHVFFFRWFHQASHVTMSVTKLLSRVVSSDDDDNCYKKGISSDLLMQFVSIQ